jgi:hypothetical protein
MPPARRSLPRFAALLDLDFGKDMPYVHAHISVTALHPSNDFVINNDIDKRCTVVETPSTDCLGHKSDHARSLIDTPSQHCQHTAPLVASTLPNVVFSWWLVYCLSLP